ncbi:PREDICTED: uncharacterized protein LOC109153441, partial [Ipomoea nil]|uniref:uncharacterized protein LOC109153441 n=1 Tax=Ipomoea nil TaxID=35883 RepID=UPI000900C7B1
MGFRQSIPDNSLFTKGEGHSFVALLVYVDDIVVANADLGIIQDRIKGKLSVKGGMPLNCLKTQGSQTASLYIVPQYHHTSSANLVQLSQFLDCPTNLHMQAAHRVLSYIKGASGQQLFFPSLSDLKIKAFFVPDWGAYVDTRRSLTGFCIFIGNACLSIMEIKEASDLSRSPHQKLNTEHCKLAIAIAENLVFHERIKHIELDCYLVREKLSKR